MRYSQFSAFTAEMLTSYRKDLRLAGEEGRNLLMEKYAYMMEFTDPAYFDAALRSRLPRHFAGKKTIWWTGSPIYLSDVSRLSA